MPVEEKQKTKPSGKQAKKAQSATDRRGRGRGRPPAKAKQKHDQLVPDQALLALTTVPDRAKQARLLTILDAAAVLMNWYGPAGVTFSAIAKAANISKATVYNYVPDWDDLIFHTALRSCAVRQSWIKEAIGFKNATGLQRLEHFVKRSTESDLPHLMLLAGIPNVAPAHQFEIKKALDELFASVEKLVRGGVSDGSIVECDSHVISHIIIQKMTWMAAWRRIEGDPKLAQDRFFAIRYVLRHGIRNADRPDLKVDAPEIDDQELETPTSLFDRDAQTAKKRAVIMHCARELFNQFGVSGVSLDNIAEALGSTKGAIYYYFDSKEDLLDCCVTEELSAMDASLNRLQQTTNIKTGLERLIGMALMQIRRHAGPDGPNLVLRVMSSLPDKLRLHQVDALLELKTRMDGFASQGIKDGSLIEVDAAFLSDWVTGSLETLPLWHDALVAKGRTTEAIAEEVERFYAYGLSPEPPALDLTS